MKGDEKHEQLFSLICGPRLHISHAKLVCKKLLCRTREITVVSNCILPVRDAFIMRAFIIAFWRKRYTCKVVKRIFLLRCKTQVQVANSTLVFEAENFLTISSKKVTFSSKRFTTLLCSEWLS